MQSSLLTDLARLLRSEADDRLATGCTLTRIVVTGDLSEADVYFLVHGDRVPEETGAALQCLAHRWRSELYRTMHVYRIPQLHFVWDQALEEGLDLSLKLGRMEAADEAVSQGNDDAPEVEE